MGLCYCFVSYKILRRTGAFNKTGNCSFFWKKLSFLFDLLDWINIFFVMYNDKKSLKIYIKILIISSAVISTQIKIIYKIKNRSN